MSSLLKIRIGSSSYLCKWKPPMPKGLRYLTYFEGISPADNPVSPESRKGPAGVFSNPSAPYGASTVTVPQDGGVYAGVPALQFIRKDTAATAGSSTELTAMVDSMMSGKGSVSLETVLYVGSLAAQGNKWMGIGIELTGGKYFTLGINTYDDTTRGILVGFPKVTTYSAADGFHAFEQDNDKTVSFSSDDAAERLGLGIHHLAVVMDRVAGRTRGYIDGALAGTMDTATFTTVSDVTIYNSLNTSILTTQFAIFDGDRSTDGGAAYPVPAKPYTKF